MERYYENMETATAYQQYRFNYEGLGIAENMISYLYTKLDRSSDTLAVDIGCGTGFMTRVLAPHFTKVIGLDCSAAQLKVAKENTNSTNITYKEGFGEDLDFLCPGSVDLITVAVAIHWMEKDLFFAEVDRVLKPGGCVAVVMYEPEKGQLVPFSLSTKRGNKKVDHRCQELLNRLQSEVLLPNVGEATERWLTRKIIPSPGYKENHCFRVLSEKSGQIELWAGFLATVGSRFHEKIDGRPEDTNECYKQRLLEILSEVSTSPETVDLQMKAIICSTLYRKPIKVKQMKALLSAYGA